MLHCSAGELPSDFLSQFASFPHILVLIGRYNANFCHHRLSHFSVSPRPVPKKHVFYLQQQIFAFGYLQSRTN